MSGDSGPIPVAIALIRSADGRYLIRRRPPTPGSPMPGYWEFPGGKCEAGESPEDCVRREILEEVGLPIVVQRLRRIVDHVYPHGHVILSFFDCVLIHADPGPDPATGFLWARTAELEKREFPEANEPIIAELIEESSQDRSAIREDGHPCSRD